jgi:putative hydrolase of the HAD superfamily
LGRAGILRGLVTDCFAETPAIWPESPLSPLLEAVSFSCHTGYRKPEPGAYLMAARALGVEPSECLFVGDGGSYELAGATALGMSAIRFIPPGESRGESIDEDANWVGDAIWELNELVPLLS